MSKSEVCRRQRVGMFAHTKMHACVYVSLSFISFFLSFFALSVKCKKKAREISVNGAKKTPSEWQAGKRLRREQKKE
ncbi:hypothetical protein TRSC58_07552 [Trypanosoma rangeli SC58]|uniref:Transmembrane protein n=1 Tax=Trypanosoma rangeli SC58 TaxID=429131 RepID=A0A061IRK3_TRYRA|nr:hypothetical protein TRSC58_07552 [Trypanosoma rangeli SC58]